jgi:hypothetical protein
LFTKPAAPLPPHGLTLSRTLLTLALSHGQVYDLVDDNEFQDLVDKRRQADDFVVDDDGLGYVDYGEEEWEGEASDGEEVAMQLTSCFDVVAGFTIRSDKADAAQEAYLQHNQEKHPEVLKKERAPPLEVQEHLLLRSDNNATGFHCVTCTLSGRFTAKCETHPCRGKSVGTFTTAEEAAQAYLQHHQEVHPEELEKERAPPLQVQEHFLIRSAKSSTGYKGVHPHRGRNQAT